MDITTLVGIAVLSAVLCIIVRQYKPEMALGISIACGVLIVMCVENRIEHASFFTIFLKM